MAVAARRRRNSLRRHTNIVFVSTMMAFAVGGCERTSSEAERFTSMCERQFDRVFANYTGERTISCSCYGAAIARQPRAVRAAHTEIVKETLRTQFWNEDIPGMGGLKPQPGRFERSDINAFIGFVADYVSYGGPEVAC